MRQNNKLAAYESFDEKILHILSDEVLAKIQNGVANWEEDVPESVMKAIKFYNLFGYREQSEEKLVKVD
jgi:hypothetical protein